MTFERHSVRFVGAGPGDPDLMTVAAVKALGRAEVVVHDRLITDAVLAIAASAAVLIDVGKTGFGPSVPQSEINALLIHHARAGARVVRLKGGDPSLFGRLDEEIMALDAAGLSWDVIPGVTAASAAAATLGRSLTRRGRNAGIRVMSARTAEGLAEHDWMRLATSQEVGAVYMGKRAARFIQGRLLLHGADPGMPVSVVENASRDDERVIETVLARLSDDVAAADLSGPAVIFLGLAARTAAMAEVAR